MKGTTFIFPKNLTFNDTKNSMNEINTKKSSQTYTIDNNRLIMKNRLLII